MRLNYLGVSKFYTFSKTQPDIFIINLYVVDKYIKKNTGMSIAMYKLLIQTIAGLVDQLKGNLGKTR